MYFTCAPAVIAKQCETLVFTFICFAFGSFSILPSCLFSPYSLAWLGIPAEAAIKNGPRIECRDAMLCADLFAQRALGTFVFLLVALFEVISSDSGCSCSGFICIAAAALLRKFEIPWMGKARRYVDSSSTCQKLCMSSANESCKHFPGRSWSSSHCRCRCCCSWCLMMMK